MKKLIILSAAAVFAAYASEAQNSVAALKKDVKTVSKEEKLLRHEKKEDHKELRLLKGKEVSYQAKQQFAIDFGNVPGVTWRREKNIDVATFTKKGVTKSAYYDYDAQLVGTTSKKKFTDLPVKAQEFINKKYGDYTKGDVILFDDNEVNETDMVLYGYQFDDADNYFIELMKSGKKIVLKSDMAGDVSYFTQLK